ncbi:MAG: NAD(P)-dependent oxidoreductase [Planctomycetaceae bacterium]|jgi:3-hydroxyisobutyrate dehydrogenase-like beta-hydroxyacid dehydrogenase|nr:NAD(P)-dependent oxidoreductase [Planctomycetaceae bacterium]MBT6153428.1 NAD(P)-dependent oxidoreductase [Planctomycetaceae bacterium]MBT6487303.1 NAD(P)-dependent oxidoreductase [Planctomycetaceae bacterium]MBT6493700.1 NAD(P)-dependent oxidoreductase [Planctomycetaceae bacterium]
MQQVGIVGVGLLGTAMAGRLLRDGFDVVGFDLDQQRREQLSELGGRPVESAREVAHSCKRIVLSLPNSGIAVAVIDDIVGSLSPDSIVIDTTTGDPETMKGLGNRLAEHGVSYLDSTVAGSSKQAHLGDVVVMVGGDSRAFESCRDIYGAIARETVHVGECGSGAQMKLVVNLILGLNRAVLAEGLSYARSLGLDLRNVLDLLKLTVAYSRVMDSKGEKMVAGDFSTEARLSQHLKDVRLILATASETDRSLPLSRLHEDLLASLDAAGHGNEDNSAVFKAYE